MKSKLASAFVRQSFRLGRVLGAAAAVVLAGAATASVALAADYPSKPVKFVIPYPPGVVDAPGRLLADRLSKAMGQPFIVENRPGAGGGVGALAVARSPADGYTLLYAGGGLFTVNPTLYKNPVFARSQFEPIATVGETPFVFIARKDLPANNLKELAELMKKEPGKIKYGKISHGSQFHLMWEQFAAENSLKYANVSIGSANLLSTLLSGDLDVTTMTAAPLMQYLENGQLKALAVTGEKRIASLPNVPTVTEAGYASLNNMGDYFLMAPKGTPKNVVDRLVKEINAIAKDPTYLSAMAAIRVAPPKIDNPADFDKFLTVKEKEWSDIVKKTGVVVE